MDFFCDNPDSEQEDDSGRNDSHFVRAVFDHLLEHDVLARFTAIHLLSDNAGKHFKNWHTMRYMALVVLACVQEYGLQRFEWHMFAPYHGWGLCDSHGGVLNQVKHRHELAFDVPSSAHQMTDLASSACQNTTAVVLDSIPRDDAVDSEALHDIMEMHSFVFTVIDKAVDDESIDLVQLTAREYVNEGSTLTHTYRL